MSGPAWSVSSIDILISGLLLWSSFPVLLAWLSRYRDKRIREKKKKKSAFEKNPTGEKIKIKTTTPRGLTTYSARCGAGIEVTHSMRALHTPLHEVTVGSGYRLRTHTWPTYPSLLHTHTSLWFSAGAAHVNCSPALVFRMGTGPTKSAFGLRSVDNTARKSNRLKNTINFTFYRVHEKTLDDGSEFRTPSGQFDFSSI